SGKQMEVPACKKAKPKGRRRRKAPPGRETARGTGVQKGEAEGEEKAKAPPERETVRAAGVQKGEVEGEEKAKAPPEPPACKIIQQKAIVPVQQG
ncbi:MAG: hypothetical protein ACLTDS_07050, partial [Bianqueaceae bacterium]